MTPIRIFLTKAQTETDQSIFLLRACLFFFWLSLILCIFSLFASSSEQSIPLRSEPPQLFSRRSWCFLIVIWEALWLPYVRSTRFWERDSDGQRHREAGGGMDGGQSILASDYILFPSAQTTELWNQAWSEDFMYSLIKNKNRNMILIHFDLNVCIFLLFNFQ